ncbi:MAG: glycosyltransferase family 2 protein [Planctomycetota bacterium]|jgi:GT2 family glycosyltransferase
MVDVSIIIVNWNTRELLQGCLRSIREQTRDINYEIIVVDNASTDGSVEIVKKNFPKVMLVENSSNLGFARASNIGIRSSKGRYICLINSDVIVLDDCIKNLMSFMDEHPGTGMAGPRILNPDRTLQPSCRHFPTIWNNLCQALTLNHLFPRTRFFSGPFMKYWAHDEVRKVEVVTGCFWMVRCEAVDEVGSLDKDFFIYGEDIDWCKRFHEAGWDVIFYPKAEAIHVGAASSNNAPIRFYLEMQKADLKYWRKHHGKIGKAGYTAVILLRNALRMIARALQYAFWPSRRETAGFKLRRSIACIRWVLHI